MKNKKKIQNSIYTNDNDKVESLFFNEVKLFNDDNILKVSQKLYLILINSKYYNFTWYCQKKNEYIMFGKYEINFELDFSLKDLQYTINTLNKE